MTALFATLLLAGVEFNRDVRPLLSDACFTCHGPDAAKRKAGLRLDTAEGVKHAFGTGEAWRRMHDPKKPMPPRAATRQLSAAEKATLKTWMDAGAKWQPHWAFIPPLRPVPPAVKDRVLTSIDRFIASRLERDGQTMSPDADRPTWLRRVTLDLTGVPPTVEEQLAFEGDTRPDAFERVVDRLLASPRFGEKFAIRWLEAARYADTSGYQSDGERVMWRWRDWVIEALNANMPFDQFTVEQLAGDLVYGSKLPQKIATGFNRNHRGNAEGGIVPEEYAVEYVADRVETTAAVWLGLTMTCSRCHDHKYDPITQKEFYQVFAFFNNIPEQGKARKLGNSLPWISSPTPRQAAELKDVEESISGQRARLLQLEPDIQLAAKDVIPALGVGRGRLTLPSGPRGTRNEFRDRARRMHPSEYDGRGYYESETSGAFGFLDRFSIEVWLTPEEVSRGTVVSRMTDVPEGDGYAVRLNRGRVQVNLVKRWLDDAIRVETEERLKPGERRHLLVVYDGSRVATGVRVYLDGKRAKMRVLLDDLNQTFESKEPFRVGAGNGPLDRYRGLVYEVKIHPRELDDEEALLAAQSGELGKFAQILPEERTPHQAAMLRRYVLQSADAPAGLPIRAVAAKLDDLLKQRRELLDRIPTTMVMQEMPTPRPTFVLKRGQYDQPGERVTPGTPSVLSPWPGTAPRNRLGLAWWVVDERNPLTARVIVNRFWQQLFGTGLVKTSEDFGVQGEPPSHPELLDWLAVEFRESGWDVKRLLRLIVLSRVYRQSSRVTMFDPDNRLLSRFPRLRLPAEMIRDQALFAAGLFDEEIGGPSVKPYQPDGLWRDLADSEYVRDTGPALYRRGMYVYWKRTVAPPGPSTFDAPGREACSVRETRTNTPLQALNLLNDVTYVEAARVLAERAIRAKPTDPERIAWMFRRVLGRPPREWEHEVLLRAMIRHRAHYAANPEAAAKLASAGDFPPDTTRPVGLRAAFTAVASTLLNLDEAINKE